MHGMLDACSLLAPSLASADSACPHRRPPPRAAVGAAVQPARCLRAQARRTRASTPQARSAGEARPCHIQLSQSDPVHAERQPLLLLKRSPCGPPSPLTLASHCVYVCVQKAAAAGCQRRRAGRGGGGGRVGHCRAGCVAAAQARQLATGERAARLPISRNNGLPSRETSPTLNICSTPDPLPSALPRARRSPSTPPSAAARSQTASRFSSVPWPARQRRQPPCSMRWGWCHCAAPTPGTPLPKMRMQSPPCLS